jgi:hypothetical protein
LGEQRKKGRPKKLGLVCEGKNDNGSDTEDDDPLLPTNYLASQLNMDARTHFDSFFGK